MPSTGIRPSWDPSNEQLGKKANGGNRADSLPLALDPATKADADAANDAPYTLHVVGSRADAVLRQGGREVPFVEYLRATVAAGGFARLDPKAKDLTKSRELLTKGRIAF